MFHFIKYHGVVMTKIMERNKIVSFGVDHGGDVLKLYEVNMFMLK